MDAYAKINWALAIYDRRPDGYHNIDTIMQKLSLADRVFLEESPGEMAIELSGPQRGGAPEDDRNLAWQAAASYRTAAGLHLTWRIEICKEIPAGAGLGGGSADAAAVLRMLEDRYRRLGEQDLMALAASLGADIPFLLSPMKAARCRGLGELMTPFTPAVPLQLLLVKGRAGVSTAQAYAHVNPREAAQQREAAKQLNVLEDCLRRGDFSGLEESLFNDLYDVSRSMASEIPDILVALKDVGAVASGMTGSGSACFGLFAEREQLEGAAAALKGRYDFVHVCHTLAEG